MSQSQMFVVARRIGELVSKGTLMSFEQLVDFIVFKEHITGEQATKVAQLAWSFAAAGCPARGRWT